MHTGRETPSPVAPWGPGSVVGRWEGREGGGAQVPGQGVHSSAAQTKWFRYILGGAAQSAIRQTRAGPGMVRPVKTERGKPHFFSPWQTRMQELLDGG